MITNKVLGWSTGQWQTVLKEFPPKTAFFSSVIKSKQAWHLKYTSHAEPVSSQVTPAFGAAWDAFVARLLGRH